MNRELLQNSKAVEQTAGFGTSDGSSLFGFYCLYYISWKKRKGRR